MFLIDKHLPPSNELVVDLIPDDMTLGLDGIRIRSLCGWRRFGNVEYGSLGRSMRPPPLC